MRTPQRLLAIVALGSALLLTGRSAHAAGPTEAAPPVPRLVTTGPVRAGDEIEIRWAPTPAPVEELELLLSLDGGRSWHVRVSPALPAERTSWRWRVPNLPSADARIRIRMRVDGHEVEGEMSGSFVLLGDPSRPLTRAVFSEGDWWPGLDAPLASPAGLGRAADESLGATHTGASGEDAPRVVSRPPSPVTIAMLEVPRSSASPTPARSHAGAPETYPLRN